MYIDIRGMHLYLVHSFEVGVTYCPIVRLGVRFYSIVYYIILYYIWCIYVYIYIYNYVYCYYYCYIELYYIVSCNTALFMCVYIYIYM